MKDGTLWVTHCWYKRYETKISSTVQLYEYLMMTKIVNTQLITTNNVWKNKHTIKHLTFWSGIIEYQLDNSLLKMWIECITEFCKSKCFAVYKGCTIVATNISRQHYVKIMKCIETVCNYDWFWFLFCVLIIMYLIMQFPSLINSNFNLFEIYWNSVLSKCMVFLAVTTLESLSLQISNVYTKEHY